MEKKFSEKSKKNSRKKKKFSEKSKKNSRKN